MVKLSSRTLALVISAIKNMRESKGSSSRDILNYISSVYSIPHDTAKRQIVAALKRGVAHGILRKADGYYSLPTDTEAECLEVAAQELGLLDLCCRRKKRERRRQKGCKRTSKRKKSRKSRKGGGGRGCGMKSRRTRGGKKGGKKTKSGGGCGCAPKSRKGRTKRMKRSGKSRCKVMKTREKRGKTEVVDKMHGKSDYLNPEAFDNEEIAADRRALRCRTQSRSRSCSRNRNLVSTT